MGRARAGFTLVEVLIAIILIDVALLALVGGTAVLVRQATEIRSRAAALSAAANRIQRLGAGPCVATAGSASAPGGVQEEWSLALHGNNVRDVRDSVIFRLAGATGSVVLRSRIPC